jgi:ketosteroid isomerase-like protein
MTPPVTLLCLLIIGCSSASLPPTSDASAGIDTLNAHLIASYRMRDPKAYAALYTDSATFEWPAFRTVHGPDALAAMAKDNWSGERDVDLRLNVTSRRVSPDNATEFGAFEQDWTDSSGVRRTEFGRYVSYLVRQQDGSWRMDRFLGFEDSTRVASRAARPGR